MATPDTAETDLVVEVARGMVVHAAPEELPLFRATSAAYLRDPARAVRPGSAGDDMLGFGDGLATAVAPVALAMAAEVVRFAGDEVRKALKEQGAVAISAALRRLFGKVGLASAASGVAGAPVLTPQQLAEVRRRASDVARQCKLAPAKADQLVDSLVAQLATGEA